jgi:tRNA (Thr-GGU) A37 N-methylase
LLVRGLDCLDGTPLVDVKPETCPFDQARPPQADP